MRRTNEEIDHLIREALGQTEAELLDELGEQSLPEMMTGVFRGRRRMLMVGTTAVIMLFFALSIICAVQLFTAGSPRGMLLWGTGLFVSWSSMIGFKTVSWMEMNRNALAREVKRLELQVAQLARAFREGSVGG